MSPTHTPAPWKANAILDGKIVGDATATEFDRIHINGSNSTVARVYRASDARLIAKAPELLAMLQLLTASPTIYGSDMAKARALLAEIEGTKP